MGDKEALALEKTVSSAEENATPPRKFLGFFRKEKAESVQVEAQSTEEPVQSVGFTELFR